MKTYKLREITKTIVDGKHGDCIPDEDSGYYFISCKDIHDGMIDYNNARQIEYNSFVEAFKRTALQASDILITNSGTIGRMAFVQKSDMAEKTAFQKSVAVVRPDTSIIDAKYLYYAIQNCIGRMAELSNGSAQKNLLLSTMREFDIAIHTDLPTQHRIASILSAYDDLIENNRRQIKLLEEAAQRLYREWFVELRFPGHENVKIVDGVPEGWKQATAEEVTDVLRRGISPNYTDDAQLEVISQKCIRQYMVDTSISRKQAKAFDVSMALQDGDTVICSTGTGTLGRVGQVFGNHPHCTFDSHVTLVRNNSTIGKHYLHLRMYELQNYFDSCKTGSTNQTELPRSVVQGVKVLIANDYIRNTFEAMQEVIHQKMYICHQHEIQLRKARDILLPKLMSGEIEV